MRASGSVTSSTAGAAGSPPCADLEGLAERGRVAEAGEDLVGVLTGGRPERQDDVALVHPAVPEGVVGDQAQRARARRRLADARPSPASSSASMTRRAARRCWRGKLLERVLPPACPASWSTSCAGEATGSKAARNRVGSPARPGLIERAQKSLVLIRWVTTSCTVQPSQRLGCCHSSSRRSPSRASSRRRCCTIGCGAGRRGTSTAMSGGAP